ncbi:sensor histidine kinase [Microbacterium sp. 18062]|uniref:sensor histidine kinase n=1 Tax=Microbacterium sp. 18062 TaxID=2681410 RepID=UPI001F3C2BB6|nr:sensor histidine kinase [Microbacterium sp. 18062]
MTAAQVRRPATDAVPHDKGPWERYGWLMAVVWMVFLVYPVLALASSSAPLAWRALGWAATAAFGVLYATGFVIGMRAGWGTPPRIVVVIFWTLVLCAVATSPAIGTQALSFVPFVMSYASYGLRGVWHWATTVLGVALVGAVIVLTGRLEGHLQLLVIVALLAVANSTNVWLIGRSVAADALRVELATSEERESVARDVHDLLGHSLTVIKLKAELAAQLVHRDPDRAKAELDEVARLAAEAIVGVRSTVTEMRTPVLADQLAVSRSALEAAGVEVEVRGDPAAISPAQALPTGWIVREATTNVLRHSRARHVRIEVAPGSLAIEDDGVGVSGDAGNGMRGMAERAHAAGASLRVDAVPAGGTRVSVRW